MTHEKNRQEPTILTLSTNSRYEKFLVVSTVVSLAATTLLMLPTVDESITNLVWILDFSLSLLFLIDFLRCLVYAPKRGQYLVRWGWIDLLGSLPGMVVPPAWRLVRLLRLVRVGRILYRERFGESHQRVKEHRGENLLGIIALISAIFIWLSSTVILTVEQADPTANICNGGDALWWAIVTFSTVGYGDKVPVTVGGRIFSVILMLGGVGLFSVVTGYVTAGIFSHERINTERSMEEIVKRLERIEALLERGDDRDE